MNANQEKEQLLEYCTPLINRLRAKICDAVDLPGRNPFWLGLRCLSSAGWMRLSSMRLTNLAAIALRDIPVVSTFAIKVAFLWYRNDVAKRPLFRFSSS